MRFLRFQYKTSLPAMFLSSFSLKGYALWKTSILAPLPETQQIPLVNVASAPPRPSEPLARAGKLGPTQYSTSSCKTQLQVAGRWKVESCQLLPSRTINKTTKSLILIIQWFQLPFPEANLMCTFKIYFKQLLKKKKHNRGKKGTKKFWRPSLQKCFPTLWGSGRR